MLLECLKAENMEGRVVQKCQVVVDKSVMKTVVIVVINIKQYYRGE